LIGGPAKLLRQANNIIGQVLLVAFFVIMGGVPLTIIVLALINVARAVTRQITILLQALVSLGLWIFLTYIVVMIFIIVVFSLPYPQSRADELKSTAIFLVSVLIYGAVGAALIFWTKAQAKLSRPPM
jgi:hypothetical protein